MPHAGVLIGFEGGEGCGKTTQARRLQEFLLAEGYPVVLTREPGGTRLGERIREVLLRGDDELGAREEFLLFSTARSQLVRDVIAPALAAGDIVLVDRYYYSSYAYQGGGGGLPREFMELVTAGVVAGCVPDLVVLLDLEPAVGLERRRQECGRDRTASDRFERKGLDFHRRVRDAFLGLARAEPERFLVLDAGSTAEDIAATVRGRVLQLLAARGFQPGGRRL